MENELTELRNQVRTLKRHFSLLCFIFVVLVCVGCNSRDAEVNGEYLAGTWSDSWVGSKEQWIFTEDGLVSRMQFDEDGILLFSTLYTDDGPIQLPEIEGTWVLHNDHITFTWIGSNGKGATWKIIEVNPDSFKFDIHVGDFNPTGYINGTELFRENLEN